MARNKNRPPAPMSPQARYEFAVAYLNAMLEDAGPEELAAALGRIARASGGPKLAEKLGAQRGLALPHVMSAR